MHPSNAEELHWDEGNEGELSGHGIVPMEVHQVFENGATWVRNKRNRAGDFKMIGHTRGGRTLTIVVRWIEETRQLRPITGWETTDGEQTRYMKGVRHDRR